MIDPKQVTAIVVTKGGYSLEEIQRPIESLGVNLVIWDNSRAHRDIKVFGRYVAAMSVMTPYVYVQDDDCLPCLASLCNLYEPGTGELLCNVKPHHHEVYSKQYPGITLVGWGAIFPVSMIDFSPYLSKYPEDELFYRECDRVFTYLNRERTRVVDIGVTDLPYAAGKDRMGCEARHGDDLTEIRRRLASL